MKDEPDKVESRESRVEGHQPSTAEAAGMAKLRRARATFGFCREYHATPVLAEKPGGYYCAAHNAARRAIVRDRMRKLRAERCKAGQCPECGVSSPDGTCEKCLERKRR